MTRLMTLAVVAGVAVGCTGAWGQQGKTEGGTAAAVQTEARPRIGVYDGRAVAVAWAGSEQFNDRLKAKMAEMKEAKEKGDAKKVAELEAWGKAQQARLHLQGFSGAGVDEILEHAPAGGMEKIAKEARVDAIVRKGEFVSGRAEAVDVTDQVVRLFGEPSERTKKFVEDLKKTPLVERKVVEEAEKKGKF